MKNRHIVGPAILTVCLLALASSCGSEDAATAPETVPTAAPTTVVAEANDEPTTSAPLQDTTTTAVATTAAPVPTEPEAVEPATETPEEKPKPLLGEADPEFEKLLDAEEEIDRLSRESSETERFRPGQGD